MWAEELYGSQLETIKLNTRALRWIPESARVTDLLFRVVQLVTQHWLKQESDESISLSSVARKLGVAESELRGSLLFLADEPWCRISWIGVPERDWEFQPSAETFRNTKVANWREYDELWDPKRPGRSPEFLAGLDLLPGNFQLESTPQETHHDASTPSGPAKRQRTLSVVAGKRLVRFFLSYAHADRKLMESFLLEFQKQCSGAARYRYEVWSDGKILLGEKWRASIERAISECDFGLLLVSQV